MRTKEHSPLVSIVVPVYNVERYFVRAINSMLNQSYKNIEIILVNDGSKDNSGKIADDYAKRDHRIVVIHQKNAGVSVARNVGIRNATGKYVAFVDPDDYLEYSAIQTMLNLMARHKVDIVRTRCRAYRNDRKIENDYSVEAGLFKGEQLERLAYRAALHYAHDAIDSCCWLLMVKKEVLDAHNIRFPGGIVIMQDTWFYVDLLRSANSLYSDDSVTYNYMINDGGTVSSKSKFAEKVGSIVELYKYVSTVWNDSESRRQLKSQYNILIAVRTINSCPINLKQAREILKMVSPYKKIFEDASTEDLNLRHKLYTYAVRRDNAMLVVVLALIRRMAILVKG